MRQLFAMALFILPAFGWGPEGHRLVARIAWEQLTPEARERVSAILAPGETLASIASWPDEVRRSRPKTEPWHYVNIPVDQPHLDMARDCPKSDCVVAKIADLRKTLEDPAAAARERREALLFLVHLIGDLHQPLHASDHHDRGGNLVRVQFFKRRSNLHSVWDSGLLGRMESEDQLFPALSRDSARHRKKWDKGTVEDWAEQSHKAAQKVVYGKLPQAAGDSPLALGADYERLADPLVRRQIEKAGARLAAVLNASLR
jgi:hypothetical protein